jgi:hypothetical protein
MDYTDYLPRVSIQDRNYGDVLHSSILTILGDELTYNELKHYAKDPHDYSKLRVKYETYNHKLDENRQFVLVWLDDKLVLDKKTKSHYSCMMNYYLQQLFDDEDNDDEDNDDEDED